MIRTSKAFVLLASLAMPVTAGALRGGGDPHEDYLKRRYEFLVYAGQRHLELGLWCREKGLVAQATEQFLRAEEVSEGKNPGVRTVLSYMRNLEDAFWKKRKKPSPAALQPYEGKARKLELEDQKERCELAAWAWSKKLERDARKEYESLLVASGEPIQFDGQGRVVLGTSTVPAELSRQFRGEAVLINNRLYLRDEFLKNLPQIEAVQEIDLEPLRLRSTLAPDVVSDLHATGMALLPLLARDFGARPTRKMTAFVFADRKSYEAYLDQAGLADHKAADGFADLGTFTAVACAEGRSPDDLRSAVLHELTHLYSFGLSRAIMPSWYAEGVAETYGGQGSFEWRDGALTVGGRLAEHRLDLLRNKEVWFPLSELLTTDGLALFAESRTRALVFYTQAWAFVRYLREGAEEKFQKRFDEWEYMCTGAALGAKTEKPRSRDSSAARALFQQMFAGEWKELESGFAEYLEQF